MLLAEGPGSESSGLGKNLAFSSAVLNRRVGRKDGRRTEYIHVQRAVIPRNAWELKPMTSAMESPGVL